MPSHIYMRIGRYADASAANRRAIAADRAYFAQTDRQQSTDDYHGYLLHNHRFLVWSLMFEGRYEDALRQCDDMIADMPTALQGGQNMADEYAARYHVMVRFGRWNEILESASPPHRQPFAMAMWHYARGIALANTGEIDAARRELPEFETAAAAAPPRLQFHVVPATDILAIARNMMIGETAYKAGELKTAFSALRAAVAAETRLRYTEPSPWMMPVRHALGALLLEQGEIAAAERCYREDLARYPRNGWALHGLAECLERRGAKTEAASVRARFKAAWSNATVEIAGSCFCRTH
jgi:tetratricopeptide (TPR) repeat protein